MAACFECDEPAIHWHHVVPRVKGGSRTVPLCRSCHGKAHGIDGVTLGFGTAHDPRLIGLAIEMYQDGWTMKQVADFWHEAGVKALRGKRLRGSSFHRAFDQRGIKRRKPGVPIGTKRKPAAEMSVRGLQYRRTGK